MFRSGLVPGEVRLDIGGIVFSVIPASDEAKFVVDALYGRFVSEAPPEITIYVHSGSVPDLELGPPLFESGAVWTLHRVGGKLVYVSKSEFKPVPHLIAVFEPDLHRGDIYLGESWGKCDPGPLPFGYPLSELFMVNLLAQGRGVELHACGISDRGRGFLFTGTSGMGKSTLSQLWKGRKGVTLLSDDRVIVRKREGRFWIYGTPWHGDARAASPEAVPLERLFVIQHAPENRATPLQPTDAVTRLFVRSFPTFWDAEGMAFTLEFLGQLSQAVPCYELGFVPDGSVVDFVRCMS